MRSRTEYSNVPEILPPRIQPTPTFSRKTLAILVIAAVLFGIGVGLSSHANKEAPAQDHSLTTVPGTFRPTKPQWESLKVAPVQTMSFRTERLTEGNIAYNDDTMTQVFSPYTGRVTRVIAKLGDRVKKGAPLMGVAATEFVQAQSDLVAAHTQLTLTTTSEKRQHELCLAKSGALKDWLQSEADLSAAQNNLRAVQDRLHIMGKSDAEISALEGQSKGQRANPQSLILAPISGTVTQRQIGVGQYINSVAGGSANPVYTIGNLSKLWLIANVREVDTPQIRVGQLVEVHVAAYPGRLFKARVTWIAPSIDPNTHRLPVRAEIENADGMLKAMMFASFNIITAKETVSPAIPQSAIVYQGEETHVYVARHDGAIEIRPVKLGRTRADGMVEVINGLVAGESIVTSGTLFIDRAVTMGMNAKP
jgi:cobalt-zinc-cadmium efflux system membrane fusion protein